MKRQNFVFLQISAVLLSSFIFGCKKKITNLPPALTTTAVANITANSFIRGGTISSYGGLQVLKRGACLSTSQNPSPVNFKTEVGTGIGSSTTLDHWLSQNTGSTNDRGFAVRAGGCCDYFQGIFRYIGCNFTCWSTTTT